MSKHPDYTDKKMSILNPNIASPDVALNLSLGPLPEAGCNARASLRLWSRTVNHLPRDIPELTPRCDYKSQLAT